MAGRAHVSQVRKTTKPHTDLRRGKRPTLIEGLWGRIQFEKWDKEINRDQIAGAPFSPRFVISSLYNRGIDINQNSINLRGRESNQDFLQAHKVPTVKGLCLYYVFKILILSKKKKKVIIIPVYKRLLHKSFTKTNRDNIHIWEDMYVYMFVYQSRFLL